MKVTLHFNSSGHVGDVSQSLFLMLSLNLIFSLDMSLSLSVRFYLCLSHSLTLSASIALSLAAWKHLLNNKIFATYMPAVSFDITAIVQKLRER